MSGDLTLAGYGAYSDPDRIASGTRNPEYHPNTKSSFSIKQCARLDITARMPMIIAGLVYRIPEIEIKFYLRKAHEITQRFGLFSLSR